MRHYNFRNRFLAGVGCLFAFGAMACGPFFPSGLLNRGDEVLLSAPTASFKMQLELMKVDPSKFPAQPPTNGYFNQTLEAELGDLRNAFGFRNLGPENLLVISNYVTARRQLDKYVDSRDRNQEVDEENKELVRKEQAPGPVAGLPEEFELYWNGLVQFRTGHAEEAQHIWKELLELPATQRKFKTVWASYMLGRSCGTNWEESIPYFRETRHAAKAGFHDSLGLAEASLGWEARAEYRSGNYVPALHLYAEQWASGDPTAHGSLELVSRDLLGSEMGLQEVAEDNLGQRIITAFLLSRRADNEEAARWLVAVENAGAVDVASGERLALASYQAGDMDGAQRWIAKSPKGSLVTQWLQAKLFLRDGKVDRAASLMAKIAPLFPESGSTNEISKFEETLYGENSRSVDKQARGELATLQLARREFIQTLDTLMNAGTTYWEDIGYVAERVLNLDELKSYVDAHPVTRAKDGDDLERDPDQEKARSQLRHLLARKLARANRMEEAKLYYPSQWQEVFDDLQAALRSSQDTNLDTVKRGKAFWAAAGIVRTNGMELMGTELEPDFYIHEGQYELESIVAQRKSSLTNNAHASEAELERAMKPMSNPDQRFHYRYLAAGLAWQAAKMMPNNDEQTAMVLCRAGTWIKVMDPQLADLFYKALVRRCRKLPIGQEADKLRWFPDLDAEGKFVPRSSVAPPEDPLPNIELEAQP